MRYLLLLMLYALVACTSTPNGIKPVDNFKVRKYLGTWYEIARLDHSFERNMQYVRADYTLRSDGGIKVINRGLNLNTNTWSEAEGKAYFVDKSTQGHLKVSFFGPFYGSYVIFDLAEDYSYSIITGNDRSYLWLLSRTPTISESIKQHFLTKVSQLGFDTKKILFVEQNPKTLMETPTNEYQ